MIPAPLATSLDLLAVALWLGVAGYFVNRFVKHRRLVSISLSLMSLGWAILGLTRGMPSSHYFWLDCLSFGLGLFMVYAIVRVERTGR